MGQSKKRGILILLLVEERQMPERKLWSAKNPVDLQSLMSDQLKTAPNLLRSHGHVWLMTALCSATKITRTWSHNLPAITRTLREVADASNLTVSRPWTCDVGTAYALKPHHNSIHMNTTYYEAYRALQGLPCAHRDLSERSRWWAAHLESQTIDCPWLPCEDLGLLMHAYSRPPLHITKWWIRHHLADDSVSLRSSRGAEMTSWPPQENHRQARSCAAFEYDFYAVFIDGLMSSKL